MADSTYLCLRTQLLALSVSPRWNSRNFPQNLLCLTINVARGNVDRMGGLVLLPNLLKSVRESDTLGRLCLAALVGSVGEVICAPVIQMP